ncbi:MAG: hypothetical protein BGN87_03315 [Rhizobiales bacterium 65-79]|nr:HAMP domain-containing histidine kinase [Hyphomicrobiales bacterium]OJU04818.1 MAG: hypothetical protein BGN87_03315 [Rhizobiales bacterium 65-79]
MRRDNLARSTPFRLAVTFAVLFLIAILLTGFSAFWLIRWDMYRRHDEAILQAFAVIAATDDEDDGDFIEALRANIAATHHDNNLYLATAPDGSVLAGNIKPIDAPDGWSTIPGKVLGLGKYLTFRLYSGKVHGNRLIVGESYEDIEALEHTTLASFGWASIFVVLVALGGGTMIALRARRRFRAVSETMGYIAHGKLAARIPLLGKGDDIDGLSHDINEALARLEINVEGMRQVSTDIAHDLKTPLNRLRINLEEARRRPRLPPRIAEDLDAAILEADSINLTFEALLRIAQIEAGARRARFSEVDPAEAIMATAELYAGAIEDAGLTLTVDIPPGTPMLRGDRELLMQMYANLLENAIRHCPADARLRLVVRHRPGIVVTVVEDNGPGIPADEREKVFRRLYRLERSRTSPGTGLGLSLVKAVAELHGASVRLEDARPGLGVVVEFPMG